VTETTSRLDGRRTDTRERIHHVALDVFSERGYEKATLREIAERLGVTRPALYYHFKTKEEILASIHRELALSLDDLIAWGRDQPATPDTRAELLRRLATLMAGPWGPFMRFAQENESAMRSLTAAADFIARIDVIAALLAPGATVQDHLRGRLAISALFMGEARSKQIGGTDEQRAAEALRLAVELVSRTA